MVAWLLFRWNPCAASYTTNTSLQSQFFLLEMQFEFRMIPKMYLLSILYFLTKLKCKQITIIEIIFYKIPELERKYICHSTSTYVILHIF